MQIQKHIFGLFRPSFPKAIALTAFLCVFVMLKFKHTGHLVHAPKANQPPFKVANALLPRTASLGGELLPEVKAPKKEAPVVPEKTPLQMPLTVSAQKPNATLNAPAINEASPSIVLATKLPAKKAALSTSKPVTKLKKIPEPPNESTAPLNDEEDNELDESSNEEQDLELDYELVRRLNEEVTEQEFAINVVGPERVLEDEKQLLADLPKDGIILPLDSYEPELVTNPVAEKEVAVVEVPQEVPEVPVSSVTEIIGTFQKNEFSEITGNLSRLTQIAPSIDDFPKAPAARVMKAASVRPIPTVTLEVPEATYGDMEKPAPELVVPEKKKPLLSLAPAKTVTDVDSQIPKYDEDSSSIAVTIQSKKQEKKESPVVASPVGVKRVLDAREELNSIDGKGPQLTEAKQSQPTQSSRKPPPEIEHEGAQLFGKISWDEHVTEWLKEKKGHIELYLHPVSSKDPQDTIFVDYQYPEEEFQIDARSMKGRYHLLAGFFTPSESVAVAQVEFAKQIGVGNKENLRFRISKEMLEKAGRSASSRARGSTLSLTIFEGATGDFRKPIPISGAHVKLIGLVERGESLSDKDGNVRMTGVPVRSELKVEVSANGYFPTQKIIPVFESSVYAPIYLISRDKVDAVTKYFTKNPQDPKKGIIMGRVFDPLNRIPLKNERLSLSFRRGKALYFDSLPDPWLAATTETGLFGFFNVVSSFRSVTRSSGRAGQLLSVPPGHAQFIELGRGGVKTFSGKLSDPFQNRPVSAKVRLVGDSKIEVFSDANGRFSIPDIDLPPGIITFEVDAADYPLTWFSMPWNTIESKREQAMYLLEKDLVAESAASVGKQKLSKEKGSVVGGAESSFFTSQGSCVFVSLMGADGNRVSLERGPFALRPENGTQKDLCLTSKSPGFSYLNLEPGEYILRWEDAKHQPFRYRVLHVGMDRTTVIVN